MYYNTGNSLNVEKRTRSKICGGQCDLENAPPNSLQSRFRYFKRRHPEPDFSFLQRPNFSTYPRAPTTNVDDTLFDIRGASFESTSTGFLVCKNVIKPAVLEQLATAVLLDFPLRTDAQNNLRNIGRTLEDKLEIWEDCSVLKQHSMKELRWTTLGRHHNWLQTTPGKKETAGKVPELLDRLGVAIGELLSFPNSFRTDASIINYYPVNTSTIGIHRDDIGSLDILGLIISGE